MGSSRFRASSRTPCHSEAKTPKDLLPIPDHDHRAVGSDTAADIHAHDSWASRSIGPEIVTGHALPCAGVKPGRGQEPHRLLTGEHAQDIRAPPRRLLAVDLAHLVQERTRRHADGAEVLLSVGQSSELIVTLVIVSEPCRHVVELAEMAVVSDRVARDHKARCREAVDRRPDRVLDAAGFVDDH